ncbi:MAG: DUF4974 domain-containing protein [Marinilabiliaceae bacterium]|nr:DUF4974 domain-containing protein [Marinilabiliaceae bacterium]
MNNNNWSIESSLIRFCRGTCTANEAKWVQAEIQKSETLSQRMREIQTVMAIEGDIGECQTLDVHKAYKNVERKIKKTGKNISVIRLAMKYAAFIALPFIILSAVLAYRYSVKENQAVSYMEILTSPGTITRYELPDSSVVWLNAESKLRFPSRFVDKQREVELWGEGYFEVKANPDRPFYVTTGNGSKVFAYGTKFNVNAYCDDGFVETVLETGHVNVISPGGNSTVVLQPGESALYDKNAKVMIVKPIVVDDKVAWKDGKLVFRNVALEVILKKLARHYNVDIVLENPSDNNSLYRATFGQESIFQILEYLKLSTPLEWTVSAIETKADSSFTRRLITVTFKDDENF